MIDAFLRLKAPTHKGASSDAAFTNAVEIKNFSFGGSAYDYEAVLNPDENAKKYAKFTFNVTKFLDSASPHLFQSYCWTHTDNVTDDKVFETVSVTFRKAGSGGGAIVYLVMEFGSAVVTKYSLDIDQEGEAQETVDFRFRTCVLEYARQKASGEKGTARQAKGWGYPDNKPLDTLSDS